MSAPTKPLARRRFLQLLSAAPLCLSAAADVQAHEPIFVEQLLTRAQPLPDIGARADFISRGLIGIRYQAHTLIGGPQRRERFVVRDDAFDCVTYCEAVLAAAHAHDIPQYKTLLRLIRYEQGRIEWRDRNHYFAEWSRRAVENGFCAPVVIEPSATVEKTVRWSILGERSISMRVVAPDILLANAAVLRGGDFIGFVSRRPQLDFFHTGLVAFDANGLLALRHASRKHGRVIEEPLARFLQENNVRGVTLLRAQQPVQYHV